MRKSIYVMFALLCMFVQVGLANNTEPTAIDKMRSQLTAYISRGEWTENHKFNVSFIINERHEIVVTKTSDPMIDEEIKALLNYKKLDLSAVAINEVYVLPVSIERKN